MAWTTQSYIRSAGWDYTGSIRHDAHRWLQRDHIPNSINARIESGSESGLDLVPLPRGTGG